LLKISGARKKYWRKKLKKQRKTVDKPCLGVYTHRVQERDFNFASASEEDLVAEYARLVRVCARQYFLAGGGGEDLVQEGMLGLLAAIRTYDRTRGALFPTYAEVCIRNRIISAVRRGSATNNNNSTISLDSPGLNEFEVTKRRYGRVTEELVIARESALEITDRLEKGLSSFESKVLRHYLNGKSLRDIAALLNVTYKSADNAVSRIRRKGRELMRGVSVKDGDKFSGDNR
jgi:RNA polymerase sporulation-specific sigma factor